MFTVIKSVLRRSNVILTALVLIMASACSSSDPWLTQEIGIKVMETHVWNDFMPGTKPGSKPVCHAVMRVELTNLPDKDIMFFNAEGLLTAGYSDIPLRRFPADFLHNDIAEDLIRLPSRTPIEIVFRSPSYGLAPIDFSKYGDLKFIISAGTNMERYLRVDSDPVEGFETH